ncbi:hypothetical protein HG530_011375 [Fusarium avenaceum]|nr:hypothetical protein HG530_011375 [Fusarium avenaceum]
MVLLMKLASDTLRGLSRNAGEGRSEALSQNREDFLLHACSNGTSNAVRNGLDEILVFEKVSNCGTCLVANGRDDELSELVVNQSLQDLLSVFIQHLRNHIKELELVLIEILVADANVVIDLALKALE